MFLVGLVTLVFGFNLLLQKRAMKRKIRVKFGPEKGFEVNSSGILIVFVRELSSHSKIVECMLIFEG